jgi:hypothetical protein
MGSSECFDCGHDTWRYPQVEYYAVLDPVWFAACAVEPKLPDGRGMLCIGCPEQRLGRELTGADFKGWRPYPPSAAQVLEAAAG